MWLGALMAWPTLLFVLFILSPGSNPLVELVGLRGNIFLLPFLLLGARLESDDLIWLTERVALFNIAVVIFAVVQFFVGIEPFFPVNEVTEIIYRSSDVVERSAYRIPSSFSSAHAFAGTMVMTLPLLIGAWAAVRKGWQAHLFAAAILTTLLGIFIAAARLHMITAALMIVVVTLFGQFARGQRLKWVAALGVVAYVVAGNARLQRFTTLGDTEYVSARIGGSVNQGVLELIGQYPLGNGLAGGGTSVPYFLRRGPRRSDRHGERVRPNRAGAGHPRHHALGSLRRLDRHQAAVAGERRVAHGTHRGVGCRRRVLRHRRHRHGSVDVGPPHSAADAGNRLGHDDRATGQAGLAGAECAARAAGRAGQGAAGRRRRRRHSRNARR